MRTWPSLMMARVPTRDTRSNVSSRRVTEKVVHTIAITSALSTTFTHANAACRTKTPWSWSDSAVRSSGMMAKTKVSSRSKHARKNIGRAILCEKNSRRETIALRAKVAGPMGSSSSPSVTSIAKPASTTRRPRRRPTNHAAAAASPAAAASFAAADLLDFRGVGGAGVGPRSELSASPLRACFGAERDKTRETVTL